MEDVVHAAPVADIVRGVADRELPTTSPKRKMFRKAFTTARLAPDAVERQSRITLLAWDTLGADAARMFLNTHCEALGGRPLDMAVAGAGGFDAVARELSVRSTTV